VRWCFSQFARSQPAFPDEEVPAGAFPSARTTICNPHPTMETAAAELFRRWQSLALALNFVFSQIPQKGALRKSKIGSRWQAVRCPVGTAIVAEPLGMRMKVDR